jgi:hypothetical protein
MSNATAASMNTLTLTRLLAQDLGQDGTSSAPLFNGRSTSGQLTHGRVSLTSYETRVNLAVAAVDFMTNNPRYKAPFTQLDVAALIDRMSSDGNPRLYPASDPPLPADKQPGALLFGRHWRDWPRHWVKHICEKAGVPKVCAHAMRGAHASLATERGITAHVVAAALGHESETTTFRSYATADSVAAGRQRRLMDVLDLVDNDSSPIVVQTLSAEKGGAPDTSQVPGTTT